MVNSRARGKYEPTTVMTAQQRISRKKQVAVAARKAAERVAAEKIEELGLGLKLSSRAGGGRTLNVKPKIAIQVRVGAGKSAGFSNSKMKTVGVNANRFAQNVKDRGEPSDQARRRHRGRVNRSASDSSSTRRRRQRRPNAPPASPPRARARRSPPTPRQQSPFDIRPLRSSSSTSSGSRFVNSLFA